MIKVKNIMTRNVITIKPESGIKEAASLMASKSVSSLIVVENKIPIAVISENDVIKGTVAGKKNVRDAMSKEFLEISPHTRFSDIVKSLRGEKIRRFPVVEDGNLVGLVTETDIIEATRDFTRMHQVVQDIILAIFGLATTFFLFYFSPLRQSLFGG